MNFLLSSPTKDLDYISSKMEAEAAAVQSQGLAFDTLNNQLLKFLSTEAPSFLPFFQKLTANYNAITNAYYKCSDDIQRAADDLKDICVRTKVFLSLQKDVEAAKAAFNKSDQSYTDAVRRGMDSSKERNARYEAAKKYHEILVYYSDYKKRFNRFKYLRTKHAFETYGTALECKASLELPMYNSLIVLLRSIRDHVSKPELILSDYKAPVTEADQIPKSKPKPAAPKAIQQNTETQNQQTPQDSQKQESQETTNQTPESTQPQPENASQAPQAQGTATKQPARGRGRGRGRRGRGRAKRRGAVNGRLDNDEEIEIEGYMYDSKANQEEQETHEEEDKEKPFDFEDDGIDYSVPIPQIQKPKPEPEIEPFNPQIDEKTLDISAIKKEFFDS